MTILHEDSDPNQPVEPVHAEHLTAWEWAKWLNSAPFSDRQSAIRVTSHTMHQLWRDGYDLNDFPPVLWRFALAHGHPVPVIPYIYLKKSANPHSVDQIIRILSIWYAYGRHHFRGVDLLRFLNRFLDQEPVDRDRLACLIREIEVGVNRLEKELKSQPFQVQ